MGLPAFQHAYDLLGAAPVPPKVDTPVPGQSFGDTLKKVERDFGREVAGWRSDLLSLRVGIRTSLEELIQASGDDISGPLQQLQELIDFSRRMLDEREALRDRLAVVFAEDVAKISAVSREDARLYRRVTRHFLNLVADEYESRADFYRFLKTLHADHDPAARGGPTFDSAEDLIADLHKNAR